MEMFRLMLNLTQIIREASNGIKIMHADTAPEANANQSDLNNAEKGVKNRDAKKNAR